MKTRYCIYIFSILCLFIGSLLWFGELRVVHTSNAVGVYYLTSNNLYNRLMVIGHGPFGESEYFLKGISK